MGRPVSFDFASGGGSTAEFLMGEVEIEPTLIHNVGTRIVLPDTVTLPLVNGKAVHPDMAISPDGPEPAWAYKITVRSGMTGRAWSEFRGVPAGTEQIAYKQLPKFITTIPPHTTAGMMQNWADTAQDGAARAEDAASRAEAPTDEMISNLAGNDSSLSRIAFDALYKQAFRYDRNPDTAVNALLNTALTYVNRSEFVYGNYHTMFNADTSLQNGKYEIDCSSFVMAALMGITYENSKYNGNSKNYPSRIGLEAPAKYKSPTQKRYLANDIAFMAFENGWLYDLNAAEDFERIEPGDVLFFSNNGRWEENWRKIGHVSIVTKVFQNEGRWVESIEADIRGNVVATVINSVEGLQLRHATCVARFPLQDNGSPVVRINNAPTVATVSSGYPIRSIITSENLLENRLYTLFFKANIPAGRFPVLSIGSVVVDSLTPTVVSRPDGLYRTSFFIPKGTIAQAPDQGRRLVIGFGGDGPYPVATSSFAALYKGFVTELPYVVDETTYMEGTFTPVLRGRTTAGVNTYTAAVGRWSSVGNLVNFTLTVTITNHGMVGEVEIVGLPFTARSVGNLTNALTIAQYGISDLPTLPHISAILYSGQSTILLTHDGGPGRTNVLASEVANLTSITISGAFLI